MLANEAARMLTDESKTMELVAVFEFVTAVYLLDLGQRESFYTDGMRLCRQPPPPQMLCLLGLRQDHSGFTA